MNIKNYYIKLFSNENAIVGQNYKCIFLLCDLNRSFFYILIFFFTQLYLEALQSHRLLENIVQRGVLGVRVLHQKQIHHLQALQRFRARNILRERGARIHNAQLFQRRAHQRQLVDRHVEIDGLQLEADQLGPQAAERVAQEAGVRQAAQLEAADAPQIGGLEVGQMGEAGPHAEILEVGEGFDDGVEEKRLAHGQEEGAEAKGLCTDGGQFNVSMKGAAPGSITPRYHSELTHLG